VLSGTCFSAAAATDLTVDRGVRDIFRIYQFQQILLQSGRRAATATAAAASAGQQATAGTEKATFGQQVKGFAKEFAGKTFNKPHEVAQGQAVRQGSMSTSEAADQITQETHPKGTSVNEGNLLPTDATATETRVNHSS